jgi:hypothetical protein
LFSSWFIVYQHVSSLRDGYKASVGTKVVAAKKDKPSLPPSPPLLVLVIYTGARIRILSSPCSSSPLTGI